jgi:hypothetical protein
MNDLTRDQIDALSDKARQILLEHRAGAMQTERARDVVEQIVAAAAGQLGEQDRRSVALFAERLIGAVWSDSISVDLAVERVANLAAAAAVNSPEFHLLTQA